MPVAHYKRAAAQTPDSPTRDVDGMPDNGLCVITLDGTAEEPTGAGVACYSTDDVSQGRAWSALGRRAAWLVPDAVATVRVEYPGGRPATADVRNNLATYTEPVRAPWQRATRIGADREVVRAHIARARPAKDDPLLPAQLDPKAPGTRTTGVARRVAVRVVGDSTIYELLLKPPEGPVRMGGRRMTDFLSVTLTRPDCATPRTVVQQTGAHSISRRHPYLQVDLSGVLPLSSGCAGRYTGTIRARSKQRVIGTFGFDTP